MVKFSGVFRCRLRPHLTELCLRRIVEVLKPYDYELVMLYDDDDSEYIHRMDKIANFVEVVDNPGRRLKMGDLLNRANKFCEGDYYLHFENDYFWIRPCLDEAIKALNYMDVCRLTMFPFSEHSCKEIIGSAGIFKDKVGYKFSLNPHLRRERFLAGEFPPLGSWHVEPAYVKQFNKARRVGGCLLRDNFIHLGLYNAYGGFSKGHSAYFLGSDWRDHQDKLDPMSTFRDICDNELYIGLFEKYLETHGWFET